MVKKGKNGVPKAMDTGDDASSSYTYSTKTTGLKKKRVIKLSTKQKLRKKMKQERGEALVDRYAKKGVKDQRKLDNRIAARAMW